MPKCERVVVNDAPDFMHGLRLMFATDLHIRACTPDRYICDIAQLLASQRADILLLGGDYGESASAAMRFFNELRISAFKLGVYGVPGNNDIESFGNNASLRAAFPGKLLVNQRVIIDINGGRLQLTGLDELKYGAHPVESPFSRTRSSYNILLSHYPQIPDFLPGARLMLCGHTHGGQISLMGFSVYNLGLERGMVQAVNGMHNRDGTRLFVSPGVGVSRFPIRFGCPPKVHLIEFC